MIKPFQGICKGVANIHKINFMWFIHIVAYYRWLYCSLQPEQLVEPFIDISIPIPDEWENCFEPRKYSDDNKAENPGLLQELLESFSPQMCTKLTADSFSGKMEDLEQSLAEYTSLDVLDEDNKFICKKCTEDKKKVGSDVHTYKLLGAKGRPDQGLGPLCPATKIQKID